MLAIPPYLNRGVYRAPCLAPSGRPILFAVDYAHRLVEGSRIELEPGQPEQPVVNALWRLLDAADPEHSRRKKVRDQAKRLASGLVAILVVCL